MSQVNKYKSGLTLIELVAAIFLVSFILVAVWMVYGLGLKAFSGQEIRGGIIPEVERALYEFGSDLRRATSVTNAQEASITFISGADSTGLNETIQYAWGGVSGDPLNKVTAVTKPVIHSVSSLEFSYYGANNASLSVPATASLVRLVVITITVTSGDEIFTVRTASRIRCL
jgi:type II secretory pathway component PulJ